MRVEIKGEKYEGKTLLANVIRCLISDYYNVVLCNDYQVMINFDQIRKEDVSLYTYTEKSTYYEMTTEMDEETYSEQKDYVKWCRRHGLEPKLRDGATISDFYNYDPGGDSRYTEDFSDRMPTNIPEEDEDLTAKDAAEISNNTDELFQSIMKSIRAAAKKGSNHVEVTRSLGLGIAKKLIDRGFGIDSHLHGSNCHIIRW